MSWDLFIGHASNQYSTHDKHLDFSNSTVTFSSALRPTLRIISVVQLKLLTSETFHMAEILSLRELLQSGSPLQRWYQLSFDFTASLGIAVTSCLKFTSLMCNKMSGIVEEWKLYCQCSTTTTERLI